MTTALQLGRYYHIYHRGNNRQPIFFEERNYRFFLNLYVKYIVPVAYTFAYCLMNNHFHFFICTKSEAEQRWELQNHDAAQTSDFGNHRLLEKSDVFTPLDPGKQFRRLFISYSKAINKAYGRTGSLFENRFGRLEVTSERYFVNLVIYIHQNSQKHGFVEDFRDWPYSSYEVIALEKPTRVESTAVLDWFGNRTWFVESHQNDPHEKIIEHLITEDW